jgi:hypothetical protein
MNTPAKPVRIPSPENIKAMAGTFYPVREDEAIDWGCQLFDSDGFPHRLVDLGSIQVVTKISFAYAIWDRKTGALVNTDLQAGDGYCISNTPMSEEMKQQRREAALEYLRNPKPAEPLKQVTYSHESQLEDGREIAFIQGEKNSGWITLTTEGKERLSGFSEDENDASSGQKTIHLYSDLGGAIAGYWDVKHWDLAEGSESGIKSSEVEAWFATGMDAALEDSTFINDEQTTEEMKP